MFLIILKWNNNQMKWKIINKKIKFVLHKYIQKIKK